MEATIARCRIILAVFALIAVYIDPTRPALLPTLEQGGGTFVIDPYASGMLAANLAFALIVYAALLYGLISAGVIGAVTTWTDVAFAVAIAAVTEGISSPFYAFFVFAVTTSGLRAGLRPTVAVIVVAAALYLSLILVSGEGANFYVMRPVYLTIVGYLIAYLGQRRLELEREVRRLEAQADRSRIGSALHDGAVQTLVAMGMRLEGCRDLLARGRTAETLGDLSRLQREVAREYENLRAYARDLAVAHAGPAVYGTESDLSVELDLRFRGSPALIDDVLQITREAITNARRHSRARRASVTVGPSAGMLQVVIDDDGVGFAAGADPPWSIATRVRAAGGEVEMRQHGAGAHIRAMLPGG